MANSASSKKRIRSNERKRQRNVMYKSRVKTLIKKAEGGILSSQPNEGDIREALRTLDKAAGKGVLHKNNAARRKSRLMKKLNALSQPAA